MAFKVTDYSGKKFNHLTILHSLGSPGQGKHCVWEMRCDCGTLVNKSGHDVARGQIKTCGVTCPIHREAQRCKRPRLSDTERREHRVLYAYKRYKKAAPGRGYAFELSEVEFRSLVLSNCHYCGTWERQGGVDLMDNSQGYTLVNSVPCCGTCNFMKGKLSYSAFLKKVRTIELHQSETR